MFAKLKGVLNDDVGVARATVLPETRPGAGFETGDFVKENVGVLTWNGFNQETKITYFPTILG